MCNTVFTAMVAKSWLALECPWVEVALMEGQSSSCPGWIFEYLSDWGMQWSTACISIWEFSQGDILGRKLLIIAHSAHDAVDDEDIGDTQTQRFLEL